MRNTFISNLTKQASNDQKIVLIVGDLGFSVVEEFAELFPERFFNAGVAEQNMAGLAAGLASEGRKVFTYSIANFPTFRCAEQIRNDICYHNLDVTTVAVGGGLAYGALGYSHHAVQDYALMRSFPNMTIYAPGDPTEVTQCIDHTLNNHGPAYLRLGRNGETSFSKNSTVIEDGAWRLQRKGVGVSNKAIISTGAAYQNVMKSEYVRRHPEYSIFTLPAWSMSSKRKQINFVNRFDELLVVEDHLIDGGFCSWLLESLISFSTNCKIRSISLHPRVCGTVGSQETLNKYGGLELAI